MTDDDLERRVERLECLLHELHVDLSIWAKDHFYRGEERLKARETAEKRQ